MKRARRGRPRRWVKPEAFQVRTEAETVKAITNAAKRAGLNRNDYVIGAVALRMNAEKLSKEGK